MPLEPDIFEAYPQVVEQLGSAFDFVAEHQPRDPVNFAVDGGIAFRVIGRDSSGGQFAQLTDGRVLYASSEGQAGVLAADFDFFLKLLVAVPYWRDILTFSGNGQLDEMRRAAVAFAKYAIEEREDLVEATALIRSELSLVEPDDPVGALHHAVSESGVIIRDLYGNTCMSLFNRFTIDDNPMLRGLDD
jgi:hypothetical protein